MHIPSPRLESVYHSLEEGERDDFLKALESPAVSAEALSRLLRRKGFTASPSLIRTTRREMKHERAADDRADDRR